MRTGNVRERAKDARTPHPDGVAREPTGVALRNPSPRLCRARANRRRVVQTPHPDGVVQVPAGVVLRRRLIPT
eukprot:6610836-Alexandrium_andersonii.AAC.1